MAEVGNWRDDSGLKSLKRYNRKFAIFPVICENNTRIWFKHYYAVRQFWFSDYSGHVSHDGYSSHIDKFGNITEDEYIVRKLAESL